MNIKKAEIRVAAVVLLALLGGVAYRGVRGASNPPSAAETQKAAHPLTSVPGQERYAAPDGDFIVGNGIVEPADRETKVSSALSAVIVDVAVREGDVVKKGHVLARLDAMKEKALVNVSDADLQNAKAELAKTQAGLRKEDIEATVAEAKAAQVKSELSRRTYERLEKTAASGGVSVDEVDKAKRQADQDASNYAAAQARKRAAVAGSRAEDITIAKARVALAEANKEKALADLAKTEVVAPFDGEILQVKARVGEFATAGGAELMTIGDTSKLRARIDIDERSISKLRVGAPATVTVSAFPDKRIKAKVVEIGRRMGRKNFRTDDPIERIDTKILETVVELDDKAGLVPGIRVVGYIEAQGASR